MSASLAVCAFTLPQVCHLLDTHHHVLDLARLLHPTTAQLGLWGQAVHALSRSSCTSRGGALWNIFSLSHGDTGLHWHSSLPPQQLKLVSAGGYVLFSWVMGSQSLAVSSWVLGSQSLAVSFFPSSPFGTCFTHHIQGFQCQLLPQNHGCRSIHGISSIGPKAARVSHDGPESPNVHISRSQPSKTQPKFNEKTPRETKRAKWGREREKKRNFGRSGGGEVWRGVARVQTAKCTRCVEFGLELRHNSTRRPPREERKQIVEGEGKKSEILGGPREGRSGGAPKSWTNTDSHRHAHTVKQTQAQHNTTQHKIDDLGQLAYVEHLRLTSLHRVLGNESELHNCRLLGQDAPCAKRRTHHLSDASSPPSRQGRTWEPFHVMLRTCAHADLSSSSAKCTCSSA